MTVAVEQEQERITTREPKDHFVQADGLRWHVVEEGDGPTVLLVHGTAASVHSWRRVIPHLSGRFHVVALDLPGHGQTTSRGSSDLTLPRMAAGVAAVMKALGLSPKIVAGHSAGAAILAEAASRKLIAPTTLVSFNGAFFPFGGLAGSLFSPIAKFVAFNPFVPRLLSGVARPSTVERLLRDTGSEPDPEDIEHYFRLFKDPDHVAAALGMMAAWDLSTMEQALARIEASCIFVAGDNDKAVPPASADKAASRCRHAVTLHYRGYGHLLHEENPRLAAGIIMGLET